MAFKGGGLGLEGLGQGLAEELAAGAQGDLLTAVEDLAIGSGVGGLFQLLGEGQSLFDQAALQGSSDRDAQFVHGGTSVKGTSILANP